MASVCFEESVKNRKSMCKKVQNQQPNFLLLDPLSLNNIDQDDSKIDEGFNSDSALHYYPEDRRLSNGNEAYDEGSIIPKDRDLPTPSISLAHVNK